jgi:FHA domain
LIELWIASAAAGVVVVVVVVSVLLWRRRTRGRATLRVARMRTGHRSMRHPLRRPLAPSSAFLAGAPIGVGGYAPEAASSAIASNGADQSGQVVNPHAISDQITHRSAPPALAAQLEPASPSMAPTGYGGMAPASNRLTLEFDQGTVLSLLGPVVAGRDPVPPPSHPTAQVVRVPDAARSLSKTHLLCEPTDTGAVVTDLHSTNGVYLEAPGLGRAKLSPGVPTPLSAGSVIHYGVRTIAVRR